MYSNSRVHIENILHSRVQKNVYVYSPDCFLEMSMNRHFFTLMSENNWLCVLTFLKTYNIFKNIIEGFFEALKGSRNIPIPSNVGNLLS